MWQPWCQEWPEQRFWKFPTQKSPVMVVDSYARGLGTCTCIQLTLCLWQGFLAYSESGVCISRPLSRRFDCKDFSLSSKYSTQIRVFVGGSISLEVYESRNQGNWHFSGWIVISNNTSGSGCSLQPYHLFVCIIHPPESPRRDRKPVQRFNQAFMSRCFWASPFTILYFLSIQSQRQCQITQ